MRVKWTIDIATTEHKKLMSDRAQNIYYISGSVILLILLALNTYSLNKISAEQKKYDNSTKKQAIAGVSLNDLSARFAHANSILERRGFSWSRFLSRLEENVPGKISITSVTPAFAGSNVSIEGTAFSIDDLIRFTTKLGSSNNFANTFLAEQKNRTDGHVDFAISFKYIDTEAK